MTESNYEIYPETALKNFSVMSVKRTPAFKKKYQKSIKLKDLVEENKVKSFAQQLLDASKSNHSLGYNIQNGLMSFQDFEKMMYDELSNGATEIENVLKEQAERWIKPVLGLPENFMEEVKNIIDSGIKVGTNTDRTTRVLLFPILSKNVTDEELFDRNVNIEIKGEAPADSEKESLMPNDGVKAASKVIRSYYIDPTSIAEISSMTEEKAAEIRQEKMKQLYLSRDSEPFDFTNPISVMHEQSPDFMSNMYTCYLKVNSNSENPISIPTEHWTGKDGMFNKVFAVRLEGISIPQQQQNSFEYKFGPVSIQKISNDISIKKKGDISLNLDQPLYVLDTMSKLSGQFYLLDNRDDYANYKFDSFENLKELKDEVSLIKRDGGPAANNYLSNLFPLLYSSRPENTKTGERSTEKRRLTLDMCVVYHPDSSLAVKFDPDRDAAFKDKGYIQYVFKDVRFLGPTSKMTFSRGQASAMKMSYSFIFKRLIKESL